MNTLNLNRLGCQDIIGFAKLKRRSFDTRPVREKARSQSVLVSPTEEAA